MLLASLVYVLAVLVYSEPSLPPKPSYSYIYFISNTAERVYERVRVNHPNQRNWLKEIKCINLLIP